MRLSFHEWTTRAENKAQFTAAEHLLYSALLLAFGAVVLGSFWLTFRWPSLASFGLLVLVTCGGWWVMSQTPQYDEDGRPRTKLPPR